MFMKIAVVSEEVTNFLSDIIPVMLMILATYMQKFIIIGKKSIKFFRSRLHEDGRYLSAIVKAGSLIYVLCVWSHSQGRYSRLVMT